MNPKLAPTVTIPKARPSRFMKKKLEQLFAGTYKKHVPIPKTNPYSSWKSQKSVTNRHPAKAMMQRRDPNIVHNLNPYLLISSATIGPNNILSPALIDPTSNI